MSKSSYFLGENMEHTQTEELRHRLMWLWKSRATRASAAHYMAYEYYNSRDIFLTVVNIASSISVLFLANSSHVSTLIFSLTGNEILSHFPVSVAGVFTVVTTTLQYVLRWRERAMWHKTAANEYSNFKRKLERLVGEAGVDDEMLHRLSANLNAIAKNSEPVSRKLWNRSIEEIPTFIDDVKDAELAYANQCSEKRMG